MAAKVFPVFLSAADGFSRDILDSFYEEKQTVWALQLDNK